MALIAIISYNSIIIEFIKYYIKDDLAKILQQSQKGILRYKGKIYVLYQIIDNIIKNYYNNLLQGYPGIVKTVKFIKKYYIFSKLKK